MGVKECKRCSKTYAASTEFFHAHKGTLDRLNSWCIACYKERDKARYKIHKELGLKRNRGCPIKEKERNKRYRMEQLEHYRALDRNFQRKRNLDPGYRLSQSVGRRIRDGLASKRTGSLRHLPYSVEELKNHIERQFSGGMNWENYGKFWHIDHIRPISFFNLTGEVDDKFIECWSLSNLRPLEKFKNLSKNNKVENLL